MLLITYNFFQIYIKSIVFITIRKMSLLGASFSKNLSFNNVEETFRVVTTKENVIDSIKNCVEANYDIDREKKQERRNKGLSTDSNED